MLRTKLHHFMNTTGITDTQLARESGVSIRQVSYIKLGEKQPTLRTMAAMLAAAKRLSGRRRVAITDLFDFSIQKAA